MSPTEIIRQLLRVDRPAATFILAGLGLLAAAAILSSWAIDPGSAGILALEIAGCSILTYTLSKAVQDSAIRRFLAWLFVGLITIGSVVMLASIVLRQTNFLPQPTCLIYFWRECNETRGHMSGNRESTFSGGDKFLWLFVTSLSINALVLCRSYLHQLKMDTYLQGLWRGRLFQLSGNAQQVFEVELYLTNHNRQRMSGVVVYKVHDLKRDRTISKGVDALDSYAHNKRFRIDGIWEPKFVRQIHVNYSRGHLQDDPAFYDYSCLVESWVRPSLAVKVQRAGLEWAGQLQKVAA